MLTLSGRIWGEKGYITIMEGQTVNSFTPEKKSANGACPLVFMGFSVRLDDFIYDSKLYFVAV